MISDYIKAYIDKYATIRDRIIAAILSEKDREINLSVPSFRSLLKSTSLNGFFNNIYRSLIILYARLYSKNQEVGLIHKVIKAHIDTLKARVTIIENAIKVNRSNVGKYIVLDYQYFNNTFKKENVVLRPTKSTQISSELIKSISADIAPYTPRIYKLPTDGNLISSITSQGSSSLHSQWSIFTDATCGFIFNEVQYSGMMLQLTVEFYNSVSFNHLYLNMIPGNYRILAIDFYRNGVAETHYIDKTTDQRFIYTTPTSIASSFVGIEKFVLYIQTEYPTIGTEESQLDINEISDLINKIPYISWNSKELVTKINNIAYVDKAPKYKYTIGIYSLILTNEAYQDEGTATTSSIATKYSPNAGFALHTTEITDDNCKIYHILETDIKNYIIVPYSVNGVEKKYIDEDSITDQYEILNPDGGFVMLNSITKRYVLSAPASQGVYDLHRVPISINHVTYRPANGSSIIFTEATTMSELSSTDPKYYSYNSVIILNKINLSGTIEISAEVGPLYFRIKSKLVSDNSLKTPEIIDAHMEYVNESEASGDDDV